MQFYIDCLCKASLLEMVFVMWIRPNACIADSLPNRTPQPAPLEVWETSFGTTSTEEPWSKPENALTVTVPGTTTQVEVLYFFNVSRCTQMKCFYCWLLTTQTFQDWLNAIPECADLVVSYISKTPRQSFKPYYPPLNENDSSSKNLKIISREMHQILFILLGLVYIFRVLF